MPQMNIQRRTTAVSTQFIVVVTSASAAGVMVLGVVLYVLIRCHTQGKRRVDSSGDFSGANFSHSEYTNSRESFIQTTPPRFLGSPAFTLPVIPEPRRQSLPILHDIPDNIIGHSIYALDTLANRSPRGGADDVSQRSHISQADRKSQDSIYSNISLPLSQYSLTFGSTNGTYQSTVWPYLSPIPGSPRNIDTSLPSGKPDMQSSESFIQSKQKLTESPSYPNNASSAPSISHILLSSAAPSPPPSLPANLTQDIDHLRALPPSGFRRRRSQPNTDPGMHAGHRDPPTPEKVSVEDIFFEDRITSKIRPLSNHPTYRLPQRKVRPEPLRLSRPRDNYASIVYARSRGPQVSSTKGDSRARAYTPAVPLVSDGGVFGVQSMRNNTGTFKDQFAMSVESPPATQRSQPTFSSPTWTTFRNSPGWV